MSRQWSESLTVWRNALKSRMNCLMRPLVSMLFGAALLAAGCAHSSPVSPTPTVPPNQNTSPALAALRDATSRFQDVSQAVAEGYTAPVPAACVETPAGAMGVHSVNAAYAQSQTIDPMKPANLLYLPQPGGGFKLGGVEYSQTVLLRNPDTGAIAPWVLQTPWPATYQIVNPAPTVFGQTFDGPMAGHNPGMPWHYDRHVWAWENNPSGDFADYNPRFTCAGPK